MGRQEAREDLGGDGAKESAKSTGENLTALIVDSNRGHVVLLKN